MLEFVKVKKDNQVKSVDKATLRDYLTAGWTRVENEKNTSYSSPNYTPYTTPAKND